MSIRLPAKSGGPDDLPKGGGVMGGGESKEGMGPMSGGGSVGGLGGEGMSSDGGGSNLVAELARSGESPSGGGGGFSVGGRRVTMSGAGVLLLVAAVAGGVLFGMRQLGMNGSLHFERVELDYNLDAEKSDSMVDHARLLGDLRASVEFLQIPLSKVQMNPFMWKSELRRKAPEEAAPEQPKVDPVALERERKRKALESALDGLTLSSVFGGSSPMALIDGEPRRIGDTLGGGLFVIKHIDGPGSDRGPRVVLEVPEEHRVDHQFFQLTLE